MPFYRLDNAVRHYAWGDTQTIPRLLGVANPSGEPCAELWMGAHPSAPSRLAPESGARDLAALVAADPEGTLGRSAVSAFGARLPYLFKILAVAKPLSIQAHPDSDQARRGFDRENAAGLPLDHPRRNYRDGSAKPEILCAATAFEALCGFRSGERIAELLGRFAPGILSAETAALAAEPNSPSVLKAFFKALMTLDATGFRSAVDSAAGTARSVLAAKGRNGDSDGEDAFAARVLIELLRYYPNDPGILAPLYMNLVRLEPGEALYLGAGILHAYLSGTGIELMANSDNVLRGGLTPKYVDLPELLAVLRFESTGIPLIRGADSAASLTRYGTPAREFELSRIRLSGEVRLSAAGPEILFCLSGSAEAREEGKAGAPATLGAGESVFVPASLGDYGLRGNADVYRASLPPRGSPA
jgi:mannose-6-phosphate isomerase